MRTLYAIGICLFLLAPGVSWGQGKQPQQGSKSTQTTAPSKEATSPPAAVHQFVITPEEKALKNPVPFTEASVAKGQHLFTTQCTMCHGKTGNGKGELAAVMHVAPPDFTNPATLSSRTDGELYTIINSGMGSMPGQGKRLKENQTWDLVNFLRTLQGKKPAKSSGTQKGSTHP